jgi:hypothetical protein
MATPARLSPGPSSTHPQAAPPARPRVFVGGGDGSGWFRILESMAASDDEAGFES